jgi:hypothetical protein
MGGLVRTFINRYLDLPDGPDAIADPYLKQWAEQFGPDFDDFERLWQDCPRADWMIALAMNLDVPTGLVVEAVADCKELAVKNSGQRELADEAVKAVKAWALAKCPAATVCRALHQCIDTVIEAHPAYRRVQQNVRDSRPVLADLVFPFPGTRQGHDSALDAAESLHESVQRRFVDVIRQRIPYDMVFGPDSGPYR